MQWNQKWINNNHIKFLSEDLNSDTNQKREHLNQIIKKLALYHNCVIADVGHVFNEKLQNKNTNGQFLDSFYNTFLGNVQNFV